MLGEVVCGFSRGSTGEGQGAVGMGVGKWRRFQEMLPQGAVSSPALFLLYANEWSGQQREGVEYGGLLTALRFGRLEGR